MSWVQPLGRFEAREGRRPDSLALLKRRGMLEDGMFFDEGDRPLNYLGEPFQYDATTGEITDPSTERARASR